MNPLACLLVGPVASLAADLTVTFTASDRSEARLRSIPPQIAAQAVGDPNRKTAVDLSTTPSASLVFAIPDWELGLSYGAGISKVDVALDPPLLVMHSGRAALSWAATRDLRFTLSEDASYGKTTYLGFAPTLQLAPMPMAPPPTVTLVPPAQELTLGSMRTTLAANLAIDARWNGSASVHYAVGGGVGEESEFYIPRSRTVGGDVGATYGFSATDDLTSRVSGSRTTVATTGADSTTAALTETWAHRFSEQTSSSLGGGLTYLRVRGDRTFTFGTAFLPNAAAGISHSIRIEGDSTLVLTAATSLGTGYNALHGVLQYSVAATGGATWTINPFAVSATVAGGQNIRVLEHDPPVSRAVTTSLAVSFRPAEFIVFEVGARNSWQFEDSPPPDQAAATPPPASYPPQWVVYAALTLFLPPLRF